MANRKRSVQMKFYITEEEKRLIDEKMAQLPTRCYGAYLCKMAIDGYIIYTDTADIKAFTAELSASDGISIRSQADQCRGLPLSGGYGGNPGRGTVK